MKEIVEIDKAFQNYKSECRWVNFSKKKAPINPKTLSNASNTKTTTWSTLDEAYANIDKTASLLVDKDKGIFDKEPILGVGIELVGDGLCCLDLDDVVNADGIEAWAQDLIRMMDSYAEISVSGTGVHVFFLANLEELTVLRTGTNLTVDGKHREGYSQGRYIAVTGNTLPGLDVIKERTAEAKAVYDKYYQPYAKSKDFPAKTVPKKTQAGQQADVNLHVQAIKEHDVDFFRKVLGEEPRTFETSTEFLTYVYSYPMSDFLGVKERTPFCCFFHSDNSPSASVFQTKTGVWQYHCFSEESKLNIKQLVAKIGNLKTNEALKFIALCLNVGDNDWSAKQKRTIDNIKISLVNEDFKELCPLANANLRWGLDLYKSILSYAREQIFPATDNQSEDVIFYMSLDDICRYADKRNKDKVMQWIKVLCYHEMLKTLREEEIPEQSLSKAKELQTKNGRVMHVNFYQIRPLDFTKIEKQAHKWKNNGYTLKAVSYEMFCRCEERETTKQLYTQCKHEDNSIATLDKTGNTNAEIRHDLISEVCMDLIKAQGYFTREQIVDEFCARGHGDEKTADLQARRSLGEVCNTYGLTKRKCNKELKEKYGIVGNGYPTIYYREQEDQESLAL